MLRPRIIPCLLLHNGSLVKTVRFGRFNYIGDPANTCRIFNELEVDELCLLDISASRFGHEPPYDLLADISNECFMPLSYGGGIRTIAAAERVLKLGCEKIVVNSAALADPTLVPAMAKAFGSQSVIGSLDVKVTRGRRTCWARSAQVDSGKTPVEWAKQLEDAGAGELLVTSVEREGTWRGLDLELTRSVTSTVNIPVIAHGGAGSVDDIAAALQVGGASAVAVGSMVVYQKRGMGVLVNFPDTAQLYSEPADA